MVLEMLPKHEKQKERTSLGKKLFSVSYIVCIINRWKIISDKAVNLVSPSKITLIFFKASL